MKKLIPPPFRKGGMGGFENHLHPHPLNHVRSRALSCTQRGAKLTLPHPGGGDSFVVLGRFSLAFLHLTPHTLLLTE